MRSSWCWRRRRWTRWTTGGTSSTPSSPSSPPSSPSAWSPWLAAAPIGPPPTWTRWVQNSTVQYISFSAGCSDTREKLVSGMQCHAGKSCRRYVATRWQILLAVCSDTLETQIGSRHMQCFGSGSCIQQLCGSGSVVRIRIRIHTGKIRINQRQMV